jgi:3'(2'), 5'-bisphosphate nucleotidase
MPVTTKKCITNRVLKVENIEVSAAITAAYAAGDAIMKVYNSMDYEVELKADGSPISRADKDAHNEIIKGLKESTIPILSEEGDEIPFEVRSNWPMFWMIDPLDGTKEFLEQNGEFTVNIALIKKGVPIFGVVYSPVQKKMYYGGTALKKAYIEADKEPAIELNHIACRELPYFDTLDCVRVAISRSYQNKTTLDFIGRYKNTELRTMGSSLKFMILAEGNADIYPRFAPTMEWDTAAAHAILLGIGYTIYQVNSENQVSPNSLEYNKKNLLNPSFICF